LEGTLGTHRWNNVFWLLLTSSAPAQADLDSLAGSINALWATTLAMHLTNVVNLVTTQLVWLPGGGVELVSANSTLQAGHDTGTTLQDAAASVVLSWHIGAYYRGGHPRTYMPGLDPVNITNYSDLTPGVVSAIHTDALAWLNGINAMTHGAISAVQLGTVSFQAAHAWRTPPIFRPYLGVTCRPTIGTQRRRLTS
jgi:hypothetical protein